MSPETLRKPIGFISPRQDDSPPVVRMPSDSCKSLNIFIEQKSVKRFFIFLFVYVLDTNLPDCFFSFG